VTRVCLLPSGVTVEVPAGERLLDVLDEGEIAGLPTACRGATCGACLVRVVAGGELLEPAGAEERRTLAGLSGGRLGCQIVCRGEGEVTVTVPPK
jgi:ferredoxin